MTKESGHLVVADNPDDIAIRLESVSKSFRLPHNRQSSLKGSLINLVSNGDRTYETQSVLNDISFTIKKGEFFGIVGRNGSGKSTLLKMLAGIYTPTKGKIIINGSLTPFIELGVGFNPELTGRENVFMNGALLGFNESEVTAMYDDIVAFAELERFMDQKLKNYSSGMQVRLAFSIAIRAQGEILLLDEVLAVGDSAFQKKCYEHFTKLKREKKTVVLVTHDMEAVNRYCNRAIMIDNGFVAASGGVSQITQAYQRMFSADETVQDGVFKEKENRWGTGKLVATRTVLKKNDKTILIGCEYTAKDIVDTPVLGFTLYNSVGVNIFENNTKRQSKSIKTLHPGESIELTWEVPNVLSDGVYTVSVACCNQEATEFYDWHNNAAEITIAGRGNTAGIIDPQIRIANYRLKSGGNNEQG